MKGTRKYKVTAEHTADFSVGNIVELSDKKARSLINKVELFDESAKTKTDEEAVKSAEIKKELEALKSGIEELTKANAELTKANAELTKANAELTKAKK